MIVVGSIPEGNSPKLSLSNNCLWGMVAKGIILKKKMYLARLLLRDVSSAFEDELLNEGRVIHIWRQN